MSKDRSPWQDGRRAWERLKGWHQDGSSSGSGHPDDGAAAVQALTDVGTVRHLLDRAEMIAVRTARRHGKSWSEIAVQLGITRQSAWERWRDLDPDPAPPKPVPATPALEVALDDAATGLVTLVEGSAAQDRRRSTIVVPNVIGMIWDAAREALRERRLVGVGPDQDGPPLAVAGWPGGVVIDQSPESGAKVPPGSPVILWIERGGSAGVREPRRPAPAPKSARQLRPEPSDETAT